MTSTRAKHAAQSRHLSRLVTRGRLTHRSTVATGSVVAAAAILSSSYTLTKVALIDVPPLTIGFVRFAAAALLLYVWVRLIRRYPSPGRQDQRRLALGGILGITLYFTIENIGVDLATPTDAALLVAAYPALTALLELVIYRQRRGVAGVAGIAVAVLGVYLIVGYSPTSDRDRLLGDILLIVSGIVWALYNFATRGVSERLPTPVILYHQARVGALGFLPLALLERGSWHSMTQPSTTIAALVALALLCSVLGLGLYAKGLQRLRASTAVNLLNLVPLFGLAIPIVFLGNDVTALQVIGGIVVIAGVTFTARDDLAPCPTLEGAARA